MKYAIWLLVALAIIIGVSACSINGIHYEITKGEHTGYVTAVEKSGVLWKTGRAYFKTDLSSSQEDIYCIIDEGVYNQIGAAARLKTRVTIKFNDYLSQGIANCNAEPAIIYESN